MLALRQRPEVGEVVAHLCQYGLQTPGLDGRAMPAMKPTRFLSSAPELLKLLGMQCPQEHEHQPLLGGRAAAAAIYPPALCRAMLQGIEAQRRREGEPMLNSMLRSFEEESEEERADFPTAPEEAAEEVRRWAEAYQRGRSPQPLSRALDSSEYAGQMKRHPLTQQPRSKLREHSRLTAADASSVLPPSVQRKQ